MRIQWLIFCLIFLTNLGWSLNPLYLYHPIRKGETLFSLSKKYRMQLSDLFILNPNLSVNSIRDGTLIKVIRKKKLHSNEHKNEHKNERKNERKNEQLLPLKKNTDHPAFYSDTLKQYPSNDIVLNSLIWPFKGQLQNKALGIHIVPTKNESVLAAQDGYVLFVNHIEGYGKAVMIKHSNQIITVYSSKHLYPSVHHGDWVKKDTSIGIFRKNDTQSGLLFQLWVANRFKDPTRYLISLHP